MSATSLWQRIIERLRAQGSALQALFEPRPPTDTVAFSIAFIALAAKLAKADGLVTRDEVTMFRRIFEIPPEEEANAATVYNLCRQETTGFEAYARKMARALRDAPDGPTILHDVLDGLFHIAMADGVYHPNENAYLESVASIFGVEETALTALKIRHVPEFYDPFHTLGVATNAPDAAVRAAWRAQIRDNHPDRLIAKGLPAEMIALANSRIAAINAAYEDIMSLRRGRDAAVPDA